MEAYNIPICAIYTPEEALANHHVAARDMVRNLEHPTDGPMALLANPLASSGLTAEYRRFAPALGGDNTDVLSELGYSKDEQNALLTRGVVQNGNPEPK